MAKPPFTFALDIPTEVLKELQTKGKNDRGMYQLDAAVWPAKERRSDKSPHFTGTVKVKGADRDASKGYVSMWDNGSEGGDDLF
jgi:hypothetical protein